MMTIYYRFNEKVSTWFWSGDSLLQIQREGQCCVTGVVTISVVAIYYRFNEKVSTVPGVATTYYRFNEKVSTLFLVW